MTLSILIVNWNTCELLRECLTSIYRSNYQESFEVIVVDNASSDKSVSMVASEFPDAILMPLNRNSGYAAGNNKGLVNASGDFLLTLNPDTILPTDAMSIAVTALKKYDRAGCLGARLVGLDGNTQHSIRGFPSMIGIFGDITGLARAFPNSVFDSYRRNGFDYSKSGLAEQPMGTFLLFRRTAIEAVGTLAQAFDEDFPIFFNEVDLLYRMEKGGWHCIYEPRAVIFHVGGASTKQVRKPMIWESHKSLVRYMRKHWLRWWNFPVFLVFSLIVYIGAFVRARGFHAGFRP